MRRRLGQGNLAEGLIGPNVGSNATLDRIAALLNWQPLEAVLADIYAAPTPGRAAAAGAAAASVAPPVRSRRRGGVR